MRALVSIAALAVVCAAPRLVTASPPALVAVAPLETLGAEARVSREREELVSRALGSVPGHALVPADKVQAALRKQPELRACDGKAACLARLGKATGARFVVAGEVGGLGSAEIVYLKLVDASSDQEIRATTLELGGGGEAAAAQAAAVRLLAPDLHVGALVVSVDVNGAHIYIDGRRVARSPTGPLSLPVGTHALRVTHPEFRDLVRFVDVRFGETATVEASLQAYPVVQSAVGAHAAAASAGPAGPLPWYQRWYTVAGVGAAALVTSAIIVAIASSGVDADSTGVVINPF